MEGNLKFSKTNRIEFIKHCLDEIKTYNKGKSVYAMLIKDEPESLLQLAGTSKSEIQKIACC